MGRIAKKLAAVLVILGILGIHPRPMLFAQEVQTNTYVSVLRYNLTSTSTIYCQGGESFRPSSGAVTTSGSSTTLTASASATPFDGLSVGDALIFNVDPVLRMITAKASGASVTISSAINLPNPTPFNFMHFVCGTAATDGWMPMAKFGRTATLGFEINSQTTATGISMRLECRSAAPDSNPIQAFPACSPGACDTYQTYVQTATGIAARTAIAVPEPWNECRVGMKITSTQTGPQSINVYLMGEAVKKLLIAVISLLCLGVSAGAAEFDAEATLSGTLYKIGLGMPFFDVVCSTTAGTASTCSSLSNATFSGTTTFTGPLLLPAGTAALPNLALAATPNAGLWLQNTTHYFVRSGIEAIGLSASASTSSITFCTSGAVGCGSTVRLAANNLPATPGLGISNLNQTAGTMAYEQTTTGAQITATFSSYTWTNAQVVALGAVTAGDITVATIVAKNQVLDAMVVILTAAAGPATVTVSCGDAIGGTPFTNLVLPGDAKAAANTVYGDAVAERGTSIDTEFWYLPSYTATTLVTCHFISSGANLDTVTGSTGRVILVTRRLP